MPTKVSQIPIKTGAQIFLEYITHQTVRFFYFLRIIPSPVLLQNSLPPLPPSPTPSTPPPMSAKASSSMTSYSPEDMLTEEEDEVPECILDFPREKLNIVENLGCGYFGDVHICEVDRFPGYDQVFRNTSNDLVIVKSLRPGSSDALR